MLPAYLEYWGLKEAPFALAPNPKMFYLSDQHRELLMRLKFALHSGKGGALVISENAGNGKTTTLNLLMRELSREERQTRIAYLDYPTMTPEQMIGEIARQLGLDNIQGDKVKDINGLRDLLRSNHIRGIQHLVIVDEGQMMADRPELLQEFRILLNFTVSGEFLLSFILSGQAPLEPAVRAMPEFWQRLPVRFFLKDLHYNDTCGMVLHRLKVAGADRPIFTETALEGIYNHSKGCPRVICAVADLALVVGHGNRARMVDFAEVTQACSDMDHSGGSYHYFNFLEEAEDPPMGGQTSHPMGAAPEAAPAQPPPPPWETETPSPASTAAQAAPAYAPEPATVATAAPVATPAEPLVPSQPMVPSEPLARPADPSLSSQPDHVACPSCGTHAVVGSERCPKCDGLLKVACGKCRAMQGAERKVCAYCGFPLHAWAKEAEKEFVAGLKRLNLFKSPKETEQIKFNQYRTLDGRVLYFAPGGSVFRQGAKVREVKDGRNGRLKGCGVVIGNRRLVLLEKNRKVDIQLSRISSCEPLPDAEGKEEGAVLVRYRDTVYEIHFPVREGRRAAFQRLVQAYLTRMCEGRN